MTEPVREPINIDPVVKEQLNRFLLSAEVPRGLGFSAFISWAIAEAEGFMAECADQGDFECITHPGGGQMYDDECEARTAFFEAIVGAQRLQAERDGDRARA